MHSFAATVGAKAAALAGFAEWFDQMVKRKRATDAEAKRDVKVQRFVAKLAKSLFDNARGPVQVRLLCIMVLPSLRLIAYGQAAV